MPGRILTMQRQARELGRLRTGYTDASGQKPRPVRSGTWIITSHAEGYVTAAAEQWGGTVERWQPLGGGAEQWRVTTTTDTLDAILPAGDPLSQSFELWSGGGCARRCDGLTETLSDRPCLCLAEHGDLWHEKPKGSVCAATTRLNVFLPDMPDVGVWRAETHSYYAASEIAGAVDLIRSATHGETTIPIRLRIELRQRKAAGKTKRFPVIVVELRGITTGQVLAGAVLGAQVEAAPERAAITARSGAAAGEKTAMSADEQQMVLAQIADTTTMEQLRAMWRDLASGFHLPADGDVTAALRARAAELTAAEDVNAVWLQVLQTVPDDWTTEQVERAFAEVAGVTAEAATASDMRRYLEHLRAS